MQVYVEDGVMIKRIKHPQVGEGEERIKRRRRKRKTKYVVDKNYLRNKEKHGRKGYEESTDGDGYTSQDSSIGEGRTRVESDSDQNYTKPLYLKDGSHTQNNNINQASFIKDGAPSEDTPKNKDFGNINDVGDSINKNQLRSEVELECETQTNLKLLDSSPIKETVEAEIHTQKIVVEKNELDKTQSENKDKNATADRDNSEALNENIINSENTPKGITIPESNLIVDGSLKEIEADNVNMTQDICNEKTTQNKSQELSDSLNQNPNFEIEKSNQSKEFIEKNDLSTEELSTQGDDNKFKETENDKLRKETVSPSENQSIKAEKEEDEIEKNNISSEGNKISEMTDESVNETDMKNQKNNEEDSIHENQDTVMENSKEDTIPEHSEGTEEKELTSGDWDDGNHKQVGGNKTERVDNLPDEDMEQDDESKIENSLDFSHENEENYKFEKQQLSEEANQETTEANVSIDSTNFKNEEDNHTKEDVPSEQVEENIEIEEEETGERGHDDETIVEDLTEKIFDEETEDSNEIKTNQDDTLTGNGLETHGSSVINDGPKSDKESSSNDTSSVENSVPKQVISKDSNEEPSYKNDLVSEKFLENKNNKKSEKHHVPKSKKIYHGKKDRGLIKVLSDEKLSSSVRKEEKMKSKHKGWKKQRSSESWEISSMSPKMDEDSYLSGNRSPTEPPLLQDIESEQAARKEKYDQGKH